MGDEIRRSVIREEMRRRNIDALLLEGSPLRAQVAAHGPEDVETLRAASGAPILRFRGELLHSRIDPVGEARRYIETCTEERVTDLFVLVGLGAGHHARALVNARTEMVVVLEPSLEILRTALCTIDFSDVASTGRLRVVHDPRELRFVLESSYRNQMRITVIAPPTYRRLFPDETTRALAEVSYFSQLSSVNDLTYDERLRPWITHVIGNLPLRAVHPPLTRLQGRLSGVPAVIISAGPSLGKNVARLADLEGHGLRIATNTALQPTVQAGVIPEALQALEVLDVREQLRGCPLPRITAFLDSIANPALYTLPFERVFLYDDAMPYHALWLQRVFGIPIPWNCGLCVAHSAFAAAVALGCDPIILVGQDLALTGGRVYADGTIFEGMRAELGTRDAAGTQRVHLKGAAPKREIIARSRATMTGILDFEEDRRLEEAPGYSGGTVPTLPEFNLFRRWFEAQAYRLGQGGPRLINATEGGASIEGFEQMPLAEALDQTARARVDVRRIFADASREGPACSAVILAAGLDNALTEMLETGNLARRAAALAGALAHAIEQGGPEVQTDEVLASDVLAPLHIVERELRNRSRQQPLLNGFALTALREVVEVARSAESVASGIDSKRLPQEIMRHTERLHLTIARCADEILELFRAARTAMCGVDARQEMAGG